jgi:hypothetical protein
VVDLVLNRQNQFRISEGIGYNNDGRFVLRGTGKSLAWIINQKSMELFDDIWIQIELDELSVENENVKATFKALSKLATSKRLRKWSILGVPYHRHMPDLTETLALHLNKNRITSLTIDFNDYEIDNVDHWETCLSSAMEVFKNGTKSKSCLLKELVILCLSTEKEEDFIKYLQPFCGVASLKSFRLYDGRLSAKIMNFIKDEIILNPHSQLTKIRLKPHDCSNGTVDGATALVDLSLDYSMRVMNGETPEMRSTKIQFWLDATTQSATLCDIGWFKREPNFYPFSDTLEKMKKYYPQPYPENLNSLLVTLERNRVGRALLQPAKFDYVPKGFFAYVLQRGLKRPSIFSHSDPKGEPDDAFAYDGVYYMIKGLAERRVGRFGGTSGDDESQKKKKRQLGTSLGASNKQGS